MPDRLSVQWNIKGWMNDTINNKSLSPLSLGPASEKLQAFFSHEVMLEEIIFVEIEGWVSEMF